MMSDNTLNTGTGADQNANLKFNINEDITQQQIHSTGKTVATGLPDIGQSTIEKSTATPTTKAKGYAPSAKNPGLVPPLPTPAGAGKAGLNKLVGDMPELIHHLIGQMVQANGPQKSGKAGGGETLEEIIAELLLEEQETEISPDDPKAQAFSQTANASPKEAMHQLNEAILRSTLLIAPSDAQNLQKAIENYQKDGTFNPVLKDLLILIMGNAIIDPKLKGLADLTNFLAAFLENPDDPSIPAPLKQKLMAIVPVVIEAIKLKTDSMIAKSSFVEINAAVQRNLLIMPSVAQTLQKAVEAFTKDGTLNPALKEFILTTMGNVSNDPILKKTGDLTQYLAAFLADPDDPSIPGAIKDQLKIMKASIIQGIQLKTTDSLSIKSSAVDPTQAAQKAKMTQLHANAIQTALDVTNLVKKEVVKMGNTPEAANYFSFLQSIGQVLDNASQELYQAEAAKSQQSDKLNKASMEMQMDALQHQQDIANANAAAAADTHHSKVPPIFQKISDWLQKILIVAVSCAGGPAAIYAAVRYDMDPQATTSFISKLMGTVGKALAKVGGDILQGLQKAGIPIPESDIEKFTNVMTTAMTFVCTIYADALISCGNPLLFMSLLSQGGDPNDPNSGGAVFNLAKACGADPEQIAITDTVVSGVGQIAVGIAIGIVTGGAGFAAMGAELSATIADVTGLAVETVTKLSNIGKWFNLAVQITTASLTITNNVISYQNDMIQATLAKVRANTQAGYDILEEMIAIIKQITDALMASMSGDSDFLQIIGSFQQSKFDDASEATAGAFQA